MLGPWYATALFWKPQVARFVNEPTLLLLLTPQAPAASVFERFPRQLPVVLAAHGAAEEVVNRELEQIAEYRLAKTAANRSVVWRPRRAARSMHGT